MNKIFLPFAIIGMAFIGFSCQPVDVPDPEPKYSVPVSYTFERNGNSTVNYAGQTDRLNMFVELSDYVKSSENWPLDASKLADMFANQNSPFVSADLNTSSKQLKDKTAASLDYFSANTVEQTTIRTTFDNWLKELAEVSKNAAETAEAGKSGIADSKRLVNENGLELVQVLQKSLMGACLLDQVLNNYLSTSKLDAGSNRANQEAGTVEEGQFYTTMEHNWDEAYGYIYGADGGLYWDNYLNTISEDADFASLAANVETAFRTGRAALTNHDFETRDAQIAILKKELSRACAIRAVHYLQEGKEKLAPEVETSFHAFSEAYGFIYSLRFTQNPDTKAPYFSKAEVDAMLLKLMGGTNGLWDVDHLDKVLDELSNEIASKFDFTVEQAK